MASRSFANSGLLTSKRMFLSSSDPLTFFALPFSRCSAMNVYFARPRSDCGDGQRRGGGCE